MEFLATVNEFLNNTFHNGYDNWAKKSANDIKVPETIKSHTKQMTTNNEININSVETPSKVAWKRKKKNKSKSMISYIVCACD